MSRTQIIDTFNSLAQSQGFYGRLLNNLNSLDADEYDEVMSELEAQNFGDAVDLILYIEG